MKKLALLLCLILGLSLSAYAQTSVGLMPIPHPQFFSQTGEPLAGCKIFTYISGTSTPLGTFFDNAGTIPNPNPVTCDAGGFVSIWLIAGDTYRILVQDQFGVQQYIIDGVVGIGGGSLNLFSTPNTWTAFQTFSGGASINGGNLTGTFTGNPAFSGTPGFTTFSISNTTTIPNLNAQFWSGYQLLGSPSNGMVPVLSSIGTATWNTLPSIAGVATLSQFPGSGVTSIGSTTCTLGSGCGLFIPTTVYSTPSASGAASIGATTMVTVGGSNATYRFSYYFELSAAGTSCVGNTSVQPFLTYTDPFAAAPITVNPGVSFLLTSSGNENGVPGAAYAFSITYPNSSAFANTGTIRAKAGTVIQYSTTYTLGGSCSPGPSYVIVPVLEQLTAN